MAVGLVYIGLFVFSAVFALVAYLFGGGGEGGDLDHGGEFHVGVEHEADIGEAAPSIFSTRVISLFLLGFSGMGIIATYAWNMTAGYSALCGIGSGAMLAAVAYGLVLVFYREQASSMATAADYEGVQARVSTAIPEGGTGEVSAVVRGQLRTIMATSPDGSRIAEGRTVKILRVTGGTASVEEVK